MNKLEQVSEILVNEINSFEKSLMKLEKLNNILDNKKFTIETKEIKQIIKNFTNEIKQIDNNNLKSIYNYLSNSYVFPKKSVFIVAIMSVLLIISILLNLYLFYSSF